MTIAFFSNFYNHHQDALSKELYRLSDGNYRFIAYAQIPESRIKLGYPVLERPYIIQYGQNTEEADAWINEADVLIFGSVPERLIAKRIHDSKKVTFRYSERPFKNGDEWWKYPYRWVKFRKNNPKNENLSLLCASAYTARDYSLFGLYKNKSLKWGYFPATTRYDNVPDMISRKEKKEILWVGRLIDWKHPDDVIYLANQLKNRGMEFHVKIIGDGEMRGKLEQMRSEYGLDDYVTFLGSLPNEVVGQKMERAGIYLFTSDRKEGWGAVLNEAMGRGCAVIASRAAGSTDFLIHDGENGYSYSYGNREDLVEKTVSLLTDTQLQTRLGYEAYKTINQEWSAKVAAERLIDITNHLMANKDISSLYHSGPCSKA